MIYSSLGVTRQYLSEACLDVNYPETEKFQFCDVVRNGDAHEVGDPLDGVCVFWDEHAPVVKDS